MIVDFVAEIEKQLCSRLGHDWQVDNGLKRSAPLYCEIMSVRFSDDLDGAYVTLATDETRPTGLYWALRSAKPSGMNPAKAMQLKSALDAQYAKGKTSQGALWYRYLDKRYGDWTREDVLLKFYRKDPMVDYFVDHMAKITQIVRVTLG